MGFGAVSARDSFCYFHTPKCASQALLRHLIKNYGAIRRGNPAMMAPKCDDKFRWAVCRNPYDRVVSLWASTIGCYIRPDGTCERGPVKGRAYNWIEHALTPEEMLRKLLSGSRNQLNGDGMLKETLSSLLGGVKIDRWVRYENLQEELESLPFWEKGDHLEPFNVSKRGPLENYMTPEFIELVNQWCRQDFNELGYEALHPDYGATA